MGMDFMHSCGFIDDVFACSEAAYTRTRRMFLKLVDGSLL